MKPRSARARVLRDRIVAEKARPPTRTEQIAAMIAEGDVPGAMHLASSLSSITADDRRTLERAWEAHVRPAFCRQLGRDPDSTMHAGWEVLFRVMKALEQ